MENWVEKRKKLVLILSSTIALIIASLAIVPLFIDTTRIKNVIIAQLEPGIQREVTAQEAEITIFSGIGIRLKNAVISENPRFGSTPFVSFESLRARPRLLSLLRGKVEIGSIQVIKPVVHLVRNATGVWNFESLSKKTDEKIRIREPAEPTKSQESSSWAIPELSLQEGILSIYDEGSRSAIKETRYEHINLELADVSDKRPTTFSVEVQTPGADRRFLRASGQLGPVNKDDLQKIPVDGKIRFSEVPIAALRILFSPSNQNEFPWEGELTSETHFRGNFGQALYLEGTANLDGFSAKRPNQSSPEIKGGGRYKLNYQFNSHLMQVESAELQLSNSKLHLTGSIKNQGESSLLNLKLDSEELSVNDLLQLGSVLGQGPPKGVEATGRGQFHLQITGTTTKPEMAGQSDLRDFQIVYPGLKEKIALSPLSLTFKGAGISSNEFQIAVGERTRLNTELAGNFGAEKFLSFDVSSQDPVSVGDLLAIGSSFGVTLPEGFSVQNGTVSLQVGMKRLFGTTSDLILSGKAFLRANLLRVPALKLPIEIKRADLYFTGTSVSVSNLAAVLNGSNLNGRLRLSNFKAPTLTFGLNIDQLDLMSFSDMINPSQARLAAKALHGGEGLVEWALVGNAYADKAKPAGPVRDPLGNLVISDSQVGIQKLKHDTWLISNATSKIRMKDKLLELQDLQFQMNRGTHSGQASFDLNGTQPRYTFNSKFKNVDSNEFLSQNTSLKNLIYGTLSLDMDLRGTGSGFNDITKNLKGGGKLNFTNGRVTSFDLMETIAHLGQLAAFSSGHAGTTINNLTASFQIVDGRVSTDLLQLRTPNATIKAAGSFGLDKSVDYQITAELPNNFSRNYDLASQIINLAGATFFKNEQGNVVVPLRMTGNISSPSFALDKKVVQENLKNRFMKEGPSKALEALKNVFKSKGPADSASGQGASKADTSEKKATEKPPEKKPSPLEELLKGILDKAKEKKKTEEPKKSEGSK